jgi:hypothetical protein
MNREQRKRRMLDALPLLLQDGANVGAFFGRLADIFSGAAEDGGVEYGLTRLLRSRWHGQADGWTADAAAHASELGQIGVLFGFPPARHEVAAAFRRRIAEFIAIHRDGLTTAAAILRLVALVYQADEPPRLSWESGDRVAVAEFFARAGGERTDIHVELHDNPPVAASAGFTAITPDQRIVLRNAGLDRAHPELRLRPSGRPAKVPVFIDLDSGLRLIYVGVVPPGAALTLRHGLPPLLDGVPQDAPVLLCNPFGYDAPGAAFGGRDRIGARFSIARRDLAMPALAPGENQWRYDVLARPMLGDLLAAWPELAALATLADPVAAAPPADIDLDWQESAPASIALRIPADRLPDAFEGDLTAFVHELEWALARGCAAGVRARVELTIPHVHERIELGEQLVLRPAGRFTDAPRVDERPIPPRQVVYLRDALPAPTDARLGFGGRFNVTPFNTSLFA